MHDVEQAWIGKEGNRSRRDGYPSVADFIAQDPDHESYIFRKFNKLTARKLLYMQSDLIYLERQLEDLENEAMRNNDPEFQLAIREWEFFEDNKKTNEKLKEYEKLQELIYEKLGKYHEALTIQRDMAQLKQPSERALKVFRNDFYGKNKDRLKLDGSAMTMLDDAEDLIALKPPVDSTLLSTFVRDHWPFQTTASRDAQANHRYFEERWLIRFVGICCVAIASILLVGSILALYFVNSGHTKLALVIVFILLFAVGISISTNAGRDSVFAGTAAYAAVLVVFVSGNLGNGING